MINIILLILSSINPILPSTMVIDNFEKQVTKTYDTPTAPLNWSKGNSEDGKIDYYLVEEKGNTFLRGEYLPKTEGKVIHIKNRSKLSDFRYLSWKWRARRFPELKTLDGVEEPDNVATVYVLFKKGWSNYLIKYTWSQLDGKVSATGEPFYFKSKGSRAFWSIYIKPIRCTNPKISYCSDPPNKWITEKVDLIKDFKLLFKKDWLPEYIEGIGILVDGDQTNTAGVSADFDDFILSSE